MNQSLRKQLLRTFAQLVADIDNQKDAETFLNDFFDNKELEKYIRRLAIGYWLKKGRTDENIRENLNAKAQDIKQAKKLLKTEGLRLALKKIEAEEWANVWTEKIKKLGARH